MHTVDQEIIAVHTASIISARFLHSDISVCSHDPKPMMEEIKLRFELKGDKYGELKDSFGAQLKKRIIYDPESGQAFECWSISSTTYINAATKNIAQRLKKGDLPILKLSKRLTPISADKY
jgi:DNA/RNA-binding domain of Phe-tRNA-synthetase-like protein